MSRNIFGASCVVIGLTLAACQTGAPTMSLDEAKNITAEFSGPFVPPPRSIADITSRLDSRVFEPTYCKNYLKFNEEEHYKNLNSMPPDELGGNEFAFFVRVPMSEEAALDQFYKGNYPLSVRLMKRAISDLPAGATASRYHAQLAIFLAYAGEYSEAESFMLRARGGWGSLSRDRKYWNSRDVKYQRVIFLLAEGQAAVAGARGRLIEAEALYRTALKTAYNWPDRADHTRLALANILILQRRYQEAENIVRNILRYPRVSGNPLTAHVMLRFGTILYEQGRYREAEEVADISSKLYVAACALPESIQWSAAKDLHAKSLVAQGKWRAAVTQYDDIRASMSKDLDTYKRLYAGSLYRAIAYLRSGRLDEAEQGLQRASQRTRERLGENHYDTAEIEGFLAMTAVARGDKEKALGQFARAAEVLMAPDRGDNGEGETSRAKDRRLSLIVQAYVGVLHDTRNTDFAKELGIDVASETFRLTGAGQSRSLQSALAAGTARTNLADPDLAEIVRREQDTQKRIITVLGEIAKDTSRANRDDKRISALKSSVESLRLARKLLVSEIESRFPEYGDLVNPKPITVAEVRDILHPGEVLISTFVGTEKSFIWAVPKSGPVGFAEVAGNSESLKKEIDHLRRALDPGAIVGLGELPAFDVAAAHALYTRLLQPVASTWEGANNLLVVADGVLGQLPFSLLVTQPATLAPDRDVLFANYRAVPWLARSHSVTNLPSVASLKALRGNRARVSSTRSFVGFGDPFFSVAQSAMANRQLEENLQVASRGITLRSAPRTRGIDSAEIERLPRLADTRDEIVAISQALNAVPARDVFLGERANEDLVKSVDLMPYRVISFATHGLVPGDLNGLDQPALALSSPKVTGGKEDGLLTMGEILGLEVNADFVVLSACNTAAADGRGAEAVSGLGRAFFYAGARSLLVSNWPVASSSTTQLMTHLFTSLASDDTLYRAEALRRTRVAMIDEGVFKLNGEDAFSYAHPIFWAPFTLVGDGGGKRP